MKFDLGTHVRLYLDLCVKFDLGTHMRLYLDLPLNPGYGMVVGSKEHDAEMVR